MHLWSFWPLHWPFTRIIYNIIYYIYILYIYSYTTILSIFQPWRSAGVSPVRGRFFGDVSDITGIEIGSLSQVLKCHHVACNGPVVRSSERHRCPKFPLNGWLIEGFEETPLTTGFYDDRWYTKPAPLFLPKGHYCWKVFFFPIRYHAGPASTSLWLKKIASENRSAGDFVSPTKWNNLQTKSQTGMPTFQWSNSKTNESVAFLDLKRATHFRFQVDGVPKKCH